MASVCELAPPYSPRHQDPLTQKACLFFNTHQNEYQSFNIAGPLYQLFAEVVQKEGGSFEQMRSKVVDLHLRIVSIAYAKEPQKLEVAKACGIPLFECFYQTLREGSTSTTAFAFWQYAYQQGITQIANSIYDSNKEALKKCNPIPLFRAVKSIEPFIRGTYSLEQIAERALEEEENKELFVSMARGFFDTLQHGTTFSLPEEREERSSCAIM